MVELDLKAINSEELESELEFLRLEKKRLLRQVDDLDTKIIGIKEEQRRRKEYQEVVASLTNQEVDDTSF